MIISASRRTDIPAFYTKWFMDRVHQGQFLRINPFNPNQRKMISLLPEDVDAIVFWTKDPRPLMPHLSTLDVMGYRYYFQFTLNDYPQIFEPLIPPLKTRIPTFKRLSEILGPGRVVWRFDPIILSSITSLKYLEKRFQQLAGELNGFTTRVMVSFLDIYGKIRPRLKGLEASHGIVVEDLHDLKQREKLVGLAQSLSSIAKGNGMELFSCAEELDLTGVGIKPGACIDGGLIEELFGIKLNTKRDRNQRPNCRCSQSVDMGIYNTCQFGCVYCYAYSSRNAVEKAMERHGLHAQGYNGL